MQTKLTTTAAAERVKQAIIDQWSYGFEYDEELDLGPIWNEDRILLIEREGRGVEVCWEEGPYQWTYSFPWGGVSEFGFEIPEVEVPGLQAGDDYEAQTSYSVIVYSR